VVEGLVFELNRYLGFLRQAGWPVERLVLGGGAASSGATKRILADATGLPLVCSSSGDATLLGGVILARGLLEKGTSLTDLADTMLPRAHRVRPGAQAAFYQQQFQAYLRSLSQSQAGQS
jgi:sugar (pentulose or hexulose) kinase